MWQCQSHCCWCWQDSITLTDSRHSENLETSNQTSIYQTLVRIMLFITMSASGSVLHEKNFAEFGITYSSLSIVFQMVISSNFRVIDSGIQILLVHQAISIIFKVYEIILDRQSWNQFYFWRTLEYDLITVLKLFRRTNNSIYPSFGKVFLYKFRPFLTRSCYKLNSMYLSIFLSKIFSSDVHSITLESFWCPIHPFVS